ncbi:hypothetical protein [Flavobacterium sp.]|uniref:hypothetical protein n=1 Tax=Flavobacterium sp. TaxID=239 RepID=UPI002C7A274A|nr:hypothetical protein [Flavobacterium sp.]HSD09022.1 hypothetical protein [Flavobacterium sp.]
MKTNLNIALYRIAFFLFFFIGYVAHGQDPAEPCDDIPGAPLPPCVKIDAPIDSNLVILLIVALIFGTYIIYNHKINKKRAI